MCVCIYLYLTMAPPCRLPVSEGGRRPGRGIGDGAADSASLALGQDPAVQKPGAALFTWYQKQPGPTRPDLRWHLSQAWADMGPSRCHTWLTADQRSRSALFQYGQLKAHLPPKLLLHVAISLTLPVSHQLGRKDMDSHSRSVFLGVQS